MSFTTLLCVVMEMGAAACSPPAAESWPRGVDYELLSAQESALRQEGRFKEALEHAVEILRFQRDTVGGAPAWRVAETARRIQSLTWIQALPATARQAIARADRNVAMLQDLRDRGRFQEGLALAQEAEETYSRHLPAASLDAAIAGLRAAAFLLDGGKYGAAEASQIAAQRIIEGILPSDHPLMGDSLRLGGQILLARGEYASAEQQICRALETHLEAYEVVHSQVSNSSAALAAILNKGGDLAGADDAIREAIRIRRLLVTTSDFVLGEYLTILGSNLYAQGDLAGSEQVLREAAEINRATLTPSNPRLSATLNDLAQVLRRKGRLEEATSLQCEALRIAWAVFGDEHPDIATYLDNLAECELSLGAWDKSIAMRRESLRMRRSLLGHDHPHVAVTLNRLAIQLQYSGDADAAEAAWREAVQISRNRLGKDHPNLIAPLRNLAQLLRRKGDLDGAAALAQEALATARKAFGNQHPTVADTLRSVALVHREREEYAAAVPLLKESLAILEVQRRYVLGDERVRAGYNYFLQYHDFSRELMASLLMLGRAAEAFEAMERSRGCEVVDLLTRADRSPATSAKCVHGPEFASSLQQAIDREKKSEQFVTRVEAGNPTAAERSSARIALVEDVVALHAKLRELWPASRVASLDDIRESLRSGELMLTFNWHNSPAVVFVVPPASEGDIEAYTILAGEEAYAFGSRLEDLADRLAVRPPDGRALVPPADLHRFLPPEVRERIHRASRLVVVPSGVSRRIPLEVILLHDSRYADDAVKLEVPPIVYAESASFFREVRKEPRKLSARPWSALLVASTGEPRADDCAATGVGIPIGAVGNPAPHCRTDEESTPLSEPHLPGANAEVQAIAGITQRAGGTAETLSGSHADLTSIEARLPGPQVVHFAAHGFPGLDGREYDARLALVGTADLTLEHLLQNWHGRLRGCELVVLSACDSSAASSIGMYMAALPWGFMSAGAESVIGTLWKVDDRATSLLMSRFYENLFGRYDDRRWQFSPRTPMPKLEALHEAKLWLRTHREHSDIAIAQRGGISNLRLGVMNEIADFSHPYYWAGFILLGNPD